MTVAMPAIIRRRLDAAPAGPASAAGNSGGRATGMGNGAAWTDRAGAGNCVSQIGHMIVADAVRAGSKVRLHSGQVHFMGSSNSESRSPHCLFVSTHCCLDMAGLNLSFSDFPSFRI